MGKEIAITCCSLVEKSPDHDYRAAHVVVDAQSASLMTKKLFWPKPVYVRKWRFSDSPTSGASSKKLADKLITECVRNTVSPVCSDSCGTASHTTSHCDERLELDPATDSQQNSKPLESDAGADSQQNSDPEPLSLALSPESDWGHEEGDANQLDGETQDNGAVSDLSITPCGVPHTSRGKSKHYVASTSPDGNDAKKSTPPPNQE